MKTLCGLMLGLLVVLTGCLPGPEEAGDKALPPGGHYSQATLSTVGGVDGRYEAYTYVPETRRLMKPMLFGPAVPPSSVDLTRGEAGELEAALGDIQLDTDPATTECHPDAFELQLRYVGVSGGTWLYRADRHLCTGDPSGVSYVKEQDFQAAFLLCRRLYSAHSR